MLNLILNSLVSKQWVGLVSYIILVFDESFFQGILDGCIQVSRVTKDCANHHHDEEGQDESEVGAQHAFVLLDSSTAPKERDEDN